jgi:hypothetical protein
MWANVHEGAEYGIDTAMAEKMGSVKALRAMTELYPELRKRGLRVLPAGTTASRTTRSGATPGTSSCSRQALRLLPGRGAARGHAVRRPGDGPAGRAADSRLPGRRAGRAGEPAEDVSVLQDTENLLAIMQKRRVPETS